MSAKPLTKKRLWISLAILVPLITSGAGLFLLMKMRSEDPGLVSAEIVGDIVAGRGLGGRDIRDDRGKPLTAQQKDRLCYDVLNPPLRGLKVQSEKIINYPSGMGQVQAVLVDAQGRQTLFVLAGAKTPEGVWYSVSALLRPLWDYQVNPAGDANIPSAEKFNRRAPFIRAAIPALEAVGITEIKAEDGEFYSLEGLAQVYSEWQ